MRDDGIIGDELVGDYSVVLRVEVKKLQRLGFASFDRKIYLSGGWALPHNNLIILIKLAQYLLFIE